MLSAATGRVAESQLGMGCHRYKASTDFNKSKYTEHAAQLRGELIVQSGGRIKG